MTRARTFECLNCTTYYTSSDAKSPSEFCSPACEDEFSEEMLTNVVELGEYKTEEQIEQERAMETIRASGGFNMRLNQKKQNNEPEEKG